MTETQPYQTTAEFEPQYGMDHAGERLYPYIANEGLQAAAHAQPESDQDQLVRQAQEVAVSAYPEVASEEVLDARETSAEIQRMAGLIEANRADVLNSQSGQDDYSLVA
ncbi:MAG: hypothetical protein PVI21_06500 [Candidatus Woesebacteria bacterium]|jgi:hypothetical protein